MDRPAPATLDVLAAALAYPTPSQLAQLQRGVVAMPDGPTRRSFGAFLAEIQTLTLGQWEELCTRTLDLNPPVAPYVGYQMWGESYQRGVFLAKMSRALQDAGVDMGGELPDHLMPVLTYLARTPQPLSELTEVMSPALERLVKALRSTDPDNPYIKLFEAVQAACRQFEREAA